MKSNIPLTTVKVLLSELPEDIRGKTVLVGGQALALWASHYDEKKDFEENSLVLSHDIDFLGNHTDLDKIASAWNATSIHKNTAFDPSINTGTLLFNDPEGKERIVDVLSLVHGINSKDIEQFSDKLLISVDNKKTTINTLSPPLCLLSRVKNLELYEKQGKQNKADRENQVRIPLAKKVTKKYISELLDKGYIRDSLKIAQFLGKNLLADAIPGEHSAWPKKFKEIQLPRLLGQQNEKLARTADKNYQQNKVREAQIGVRYKGKILSIKDNIAIQEYGKSLIAHDVSKINQKLKPGQNYTIYHDVNTSTAQEQKIIEAVASKLIQSKVKNPAQRQALQSAINNRLNERAAEGKIPSVQAYDKNIPSKTKSTEQKIQPQKEQDLDRSK